MRKFLVAMFLTFLVVSNVQPENLPPSFDRIQIEQGLPISQDSICIAVALDKEARGEPIRGVRAVLDVILKRMDKRNKTACEVVKEKGQFSWYSKRFKFKADEKMLTMAEEVFKMKPVMPDAEYFHSTNVQPGWHLRKLGRVGHHIFYKERIV